MIDSRIPSYAQDYIKECVSEEWKTYKGFKTLGFSGITECERYAYQTFEINWEQWGFTWKGEAKRVFSEYITSQRIRTWHRRSKVTTRKGSFHSYDGRQEYAWALWQVVRNSGLDTEVDGVKWSVRKVDGLKNIYVWFK